MKNKDTQVNYSSQVIWIGNKYILFTLKEKKENKNIVMIINMKNKYSPTRNKWALESTWDNSASSLPLLDSDGKTSPWPGGYLSIGITHKPN